MMAMTVVPVVSALLGPVVGLGSAKAVTSHFSVMVKGVSQVDCICPRCHVNTYHEMSALRSRTSSCQTGYLRRLV